MLDSAPKTHQEDLALKTHLEASASRAHLAEQALDLAPPTLERRAALDSRHLVSASKISHRLEAEIHYLVKTTRRAKDSELTKGSALALV